MSEWLLFAGLAGVVILCRRAWLRAKREEIREVVKP